MNLNRLLIQIRQWLSVTYVSRGYKYSLPERGEGDISSYKSTVDIFRSGRFTPGERRAEYRRRGKSPSGVIDGIYNDMYLENGASYNDMDRDWEAGA